VPFHGVVIGEFGPPGPVGALDGPESATAAVAEPALTTVVSATPAIRRRRSRRALAFFDMTKCSTSSSVT
jgi:hypothetical protein